MTSPELINAIGIPSMVAALIFIGAKLNTLNRVQKDIEDVIKPDLKDVRERFATLEGKAAGLFDNHSPISLTASGRKYLQESGLQAYIDTHRDELMHQCDHDKTMRTPYDVQQVAFAFFDEYIFPDDIEMKLKNYAFNHGASMDSMRRIGGIYFRDLCLQTHGFHEAELDTKK